MPKRGGGGKIELSHPGDRRHQSEGSETTIKQRLSLQEKKKKPLPRLQHKTAIKLSSTDSLNELR